MDDGAWAIHGALREEVEGVAVEAGCDVHELLPLLVEEGLRAYRRSGEVPDPDGRLKRNRVARKKFAEKYPKGGSVRAQPRRPK